MTSRVHRPTKSASGCRREGCCGGDAGDDGWDDGWRINEDLLQMRDTAGAGTRFER
jgi:hypothetical protein